MTKSNAKTKPTEPESLPSIRARFKEMKVDNTRLEMIEAEINDLLEETEAVVAIDLEQEAEAEENKQAIKFSEMDVVSIIGPTGSTKTTSVEKIVEKWNKKRPGQMPVVMVTVRSATRSEKQLQVQILEAFKDPQADFVRRNNNYSPDQAIRAIRHIARSRRTYVVVLDEANNMIGQDEIATARPMAKAIKSLVNEGVFAVVVMGTAKAHRFFEVDPELNTRKTADINLDPVNLNVPSERSYFFKFIGQIDRQMERDGIVEARVGLIEDIRSRAMVYDMSGGVVGNVVRILQNRPSSRPPRQPAEHRMEGYRGRILFLEDDADRRKRQADRNLRSVRRRTEGANPGSGQGSRLGTWVHV